MIKHFMYALLPLFVAANGIAQILQDRAARVPLDNKQIASAVVPGLTSSTLVPITHDPASGGGGTLDVVSTNANVVISLITPAAITVNQGNAGGLGYRFDVYTIPDGADTGLFMGPTLTPGTHWLIRIPPGQAPGSYQIKADSSTVTTETALFITYLSSSRVRVGLNTGGSKYRLGESVKLSAFAFHQTTPVTGATVSAEVSQIVSVTAQTTVGAYALQSSTSIGADRVRESYRATLNNSGPALEMALAYAKSLSPDVVIADSRLAFGDVALGGSAVSEDTFLIERKTTTAFSGALLAWELEADGVSASLNFADSGATDAAPGDGVYSAAYLPPGVGEYHVKARITGSAAGSNFVRDVTTSFEVAQPLGVISSFQETLVDTDGNSLPDRYDLRINLANIPTTGEYITFVTLKDSSQRTIQGQQTATLTAGANNITVPFSAKDIVAKLASNGPWTVRDAALFRKHPESNIFVDQKLDVQLSGAHALSSFDRGLIYFNGLNNAAFGSNAGNVLEIRFGVHSAAADTCEWAVVLFGLQGSQVDYAKKISAVPAGNSVASVMLSGYRIYRSGINGPYRVQVSGECGQGSIRAAPLFQTQAFTYTQFSNAPANFTISTAAPTKSVVRGNETTYKINLAPLADFEERVDFSVSGLPAAVPASFQPAALIGSGIMYITMTTGSASPIGTYSLTVAATSGNIVKTLPLTLIVN